MAELLRKDPLFDPEVPASVLDHPNASAAASALDAAAGVDALAIMTPWPAFRQIDPNALARMMRGQLVLDPAALISGPERQKSYSFA